VSIAFHWKRIARRAGGLFLGVRLHFPVSFRTTSCFPTIHWREVPITVGFLFWELDIEVKWGHHVEEDGC